MQVFLRLGDINGDGIDDSLIGNFWYNKRIGEAYIYYGSSAEIGNSPDQINENPSTIQNSRFCTDLDGIGDFNNDGFNDIIIGCPNLNLGIYGKAYLYFGSSSGISTVPDIILVEGQDFGWSISKVGNILELCIQITY